MSYHLQHRLKAAQRKGLLQVAEESGQGVSTAHTHHVFTVLGENTKVNIVVNASKKKWLGLWHRGKRGSKKCQVKKKTRSIQFCLKKIDYSHNVTSNPGGPL